MSESRSPGRKGSWRRCRSRSEGFRLSGTGGAFSSAGAASGSTFARGLTDALDKADDIVEDTVGLIEWVATNATFEELVERGTKTTANLLRGVVARRTG